MVEINHEELQFVLQTHHLKKESLMIWGAPGIGKSQGVKEYVISYAKGIKKEFVEWNKLTKKERIDLKNGITKVDNKVIFVDDRTSLKDSTDNKGIPRLDLDYLDWVKTAIIQIAAMPGAEVIFFKDEINNAAPSVLHSEYQWVLDKAIDDICFAPGVWTVAAGNRTEDRCNVNDMGAALDSRFSHVTLKIPTVQEFTDWGIRHNVDGKIMGFLQFQEAALFRFAKDMNDHAWPNPRSWAVVSNLIEGIEDHKQIKLLAQSRVGDGTGLEFSKFCELNMKLKLDDFLKNPEKIKELENLDMKYAVLTSGLERYKKKPEILPQFLMFIKYFNPEFSIYMLKMIRGTDDSLDRTYFKTHVRDTKVWEIIRDDFSRYLF